MNYRVSLWEMDKMAAQANSKKSTISLEEMKKQVQNLKNKSISKVKKDDTQLTFRRRETFLFC